MGSFRAVLAGVLGALAICPAASAATLHSLSPLGCIEDAPIDNGCTSSVTSFGGLLGDIVIGPGAEQVYVSSDNGTVTRFDRSPSGGLAPAGCIQDPEVAEGCAATAQGLGTAVGMASSPDGRDIYAAGQAHGTLVHLRRAGDGTLSAGGCFEDPPLERGCDVAVPGLAGANDVLVSPDGRSVYVAAFSDHAIVRFDRAADGTLTPAGCLEDSGGVAGCSATAGLRFVSALAISPDGGSVYSAASGDGAVAAFSRSATGALAAQGCVEEMPIDSGCGSGLVSLGGTDGVAVSPDGRAVYVTASDGSVNAFARDQAGTLTFLDCVQDAGTTLGCASTAPGLGYARDVVVAPDGGSVYVQGNRTIVTFDRGVTGRLAPAGCLADVAMSVDCATFLAGLGTFVNFGYNRLAMPADSSSLYATATLDAAIAMFSRGVAPTCAATASSGPLGVAQAVPLRCTDANGDVVTLSIVAGPAHGTLGAIDQASGRVTYTPAAGFSGLDSFTYRASAGGQDAEPAVAVVSVEAPAAQPVPVPGPGPSVTKEIRKLVALFVEDRLRGRTGRRIPIRFVTTAPGGVRLDVLRGSRRVARLSGRVGATGVGRVTWRARDRGRAARIGRYTLRLTVTSADGQVARRNARLTLRR